MNCFFKDVFFLDGIYLLKLMLLIIKEKDCYLLTRRKGFKKIKNELIFNTYTYLPYMTYILLPIHRLY